VRDIGSGLLYVVRLMNVRAVPERFLVAFSFAGEQRHIVAPIANAVEERLGRGTVFYDEWFQHYIAGSDADIRLQRLYAEQAALVVVCISQRYGGKPWTVTEHRAVRSLQMQLDQAADERERLRILPLRVDDGDVPGVTITTIVPDVRGKPAGRTAELIVNRLQLIDASVRPVPAAPDRYVYLAECTPDLDDPGRPVNRPRLKTFLEDLGWTVLPDEDYPAAQYAELLQRDLERSMAFVQLLGPYPWKRGDFDRLQHQSAQALDLAQFRFRSAEIDLARVESPHREFLQAPDVMATGFEDFKVHVQDQLIMLSQRRRARTTDEDSDVTPPLVLVAIRSMNPDPLWEQVFQWLYEEERIVAYQLGPGESLEAKYRGEPCQGFLVVCDGASLDDVAFSTREDMEQCRVIQMREKNAARRPPVGLVYWPPPPPAWARLLRSTPLKLHRIRGDEPSNLPEFVADVKRIAL
jgi:hypothetical protein